MPKQQFEKATIFYGEWNSNKFDLAVTMATKYEWTHQVQANVHPLSCKTALERVDDITDCIIIKDCPADFPYQLYYSAITEGLFLQRKNAPAEVIKAKFIFISQCQTFKLPAEASVNRRIECIHATGEGSHLSLGRLNNNRPKTTLEQFNTELEEYLEQELWVGFFKSNFSQLTSSDAKAVLQAQCLSHVELAPIQSFCQDKQIPYRISAHEYSLELHFELNGQGI